MIFLPKGVKNGEVVDPDNLARDYQEANRVASSTTHFQWHTDSFDDIDKFDDSLCKVHYKSVVAKLGVTGRSGPRLTTSVAGASPIDESTGSVFSITPSANLFDVPVNIGFHEITDTDISWTSEYPELVHLTFSFQYLRKALRFYRYITSDHESQVGDATYSKTPRHRLQLMIELDGALLIGTGPYGNNTEGSFRGLGYGGRQLVTSVNTMQLVSAGFHTVRAKCCILPLTNAVNNDADESRSIRLNGVVGGASGTTDGWEKDVCIGNRSMLVTRYGRGMFLGA
tara:strand:+ start:16290 stop:17141 length:852 start_codon:yes stop_codon:yes gene_type:complete